MSAQTARWNHLPIGKIAHPRLGGNYKNTESVASRPLVKMGNIARVRIDLSRLEYIPDSEYVDPIHQLRYGDVLFNTRNTLDLVGKVSIWRSELPLAFYNSNILRLEFKPEFCGDPQYFGYALNSAESIKAIRNLATGTTSVAAVYTRDLLELKLDVPPRGEQRAIAEALHDADRLISTLEQQISKKQAIKQGMMQELLTGKTRLPGFTGEWHETTIGNVAQLAGGGTPSRSVAEYWNGKLPWATVKDISTFTAAGTQEYITEAGLRASAARLVPAGTPVLAARMLVGKAVRFSVDVSINQDLKALELSEQADPLFVCHWFDANGSRLASSAGGSTVAGTSTSEIKGLSINLPRVEEQAAIAAALDGADQELMGLRARLAKARAIKTGMMQELLTGRTRLPAEEVAV